MTATDKKHQKISRHASICGQQFYDCSLFILHFLFSSECLAVSWVVLDCRSFHWRHENTSQNVHLIITRNILMVLYMVQDLIHDVLARGTSCCTFLLIHHDSRLSDQSFPEYHFPHLLMKLSLVPQSSPLHQNTIESTFVNSKLS